MNAELLGLLDQLVDGGSSLRWTDVVMVSNVGAIPPAQDLQGDFVWNRGFNLLVVGMFGRPRYFCKCRRAGDERLRREIDIMEALGADPALHRHVPAVTSGQSERLQILVSKYVGPSTLLEALHGPPRPTFTRVMDATVDAMLIVSRHASQTLEPMKHRGPVVLSREIVSVLDYLETAGVARSDIAVLARALDDIAPLPRLLQHGDVWPNNLIWRHGSVWMLDFEMFGEVQVPMYDAFHFLRTCSDLWAPDGGKTAWCDRMLADGVATDLARDAARRAVTSLGLSRAQAVGALIFYVTHFAATTHRRNPDGTVWVRFLRETRRLAEWLREGRALEPIFFGA